MEGVEKGGQCQSMLVWNHDASVTEAKSSVGYGSFRARMYSPVENHRYQHHFQTVRICMGRVKV